MNAQPSVLIVDDEDGICEILAMEFEDSGCQVKTAANGNLALELYRKQDFDILITDVRMPECDGVTLVNELKKTHENIFFVFMTGYTDYSQEDLLSLGAKKIYKKPFDLAGFSEEVLRLYRSV